MNKAQRLIFFELFFKSNFKKTTLKSITTNTGNYFS